MLLVAVDGSAEDAVASLEKLMMEFPSLIVQSTQGIHEAILQYAKIVFAHTQTLNSVWLNDTDDLEE